VAKAGGYEAYYQSIKDQFAAINGHEPNDDEIRTFYRQMLSTP
jgi:hypothetical protein